MEVNKNFSKIVMIKKINRFTVEKAFGVWQSSLI